MQADKIHRHYKATEIRDIGLAALGRHGTHAHARQQMRAGFTSPIETILSERRRLEEREVTALSSKVLFDSSDCERGFRGAEILGWRTRAGLFAQRLALFQERSKLLLLFGDTVGRPRLVARSRESGRLFGERSDVFADCRDAFVEFDEGCSVCHDVSFLRSPESGDAALAPRRHAHCGPRPVALLFYAFLEPPRDGARRLHTPSTSTYSTVAAYSRIFLAR